MHSPPGSSTLRRVLIHQQKGRTQLSKGITISIVAMYGSCRHPPSHGANTPCPRHTPLRTRTPTGNTQWRFQNSLYTFATACQLYRYEYVPILLSEIKTLLHLRNSQGSHANSVIAESRNETEINTSQLTFGGRKFILNFVDISRKL
jgi:hypothetical protein